MRVQIDNVTNTNQQHSPANPSFGAIPKWNIVLMHWFIDNTKAQGSITTKALAGGGYVRFQAWPERTKEMHFAVWVCLSGCLRPM